MRLIGIHVSDHLAGDHFGFAALLFLQIGLSGEAFANPFDNVGFGARSTAMANAMTAEATQVYEYDDTGRLLDCR